MLTTQTIIIYYLPFDRLTEDNIAEKCKKFKEDFNILYEVLPSFTGQEGYVTTPYEVDVPQGQYQIGTPTYWPTTSWGSITAPSGSTLFISTSVGNGSLNIETTN